MKRIGILPLLVFLATISYYGAAGQTFQQSYPAAGAHIINSLTETASDFTIPTKNGLTNGTLKVNKTTGSQISFTPGATDCDMTPFSGDYRINANEFIDYNKNSNISINVRHVTFNGNCGITNNYSIDINDIPTNQNLTITNVLYTGGANPAIFVGGIMQLTPVGSATQYNIFIKKLNDNISGTPIWSYSFPAPLTISGSVPAFSLQLATQSGGVVAALGTPTSTDLKLLKINSNGQLAFFNTLGSPTMQILGMTEGASESLLIRTKTIGFSGPSDATQFTKWNTSGTQVYSVAPGNVLSSYLGTFQFYVDLTAHLQTSNGDVIIAGKSTGVVGTPGNYMMRIATNGTVLWTDFYAGLNADLTHILQASNGGFLLGGRLNNQLFLKKTAPYTGGPADLSLELLSNTEANGIVQHVIRLTNSGPTAASNLQVGFNFIPGTIISYFTTPQATFVNNTWTIASLASGASISMDIGFVTLPPCNDFGYLAQVNSSSQADPDSSPGNADPNNLEDDAINIVMSQGCPPSVDLELSLLQTPASPAIYSIYNVKATIKNTGALPASGVKISFKKPVGVVYTGGNEYTASQGSFTPNGNEEWTVGSLAAGASATLTVNYFLLQNTAPVAYAQVVAADQQDVDSQPNNGTPPTPNQDDEASTGTIANPTGADLTPTTFSGGITLNSNVRYFNYSLLATNSGTPLTAQQTPVTAGFYLSADNVLSTNDILIHQASLTSSPSPNTYFNTGDLISISNTIPAGSYFLIAKVDDANNIAELIEINNTISIQVTVPAVTISQSDLTITGLVASAASGAQGAVVPYSYTLKNIGAATAAGSYLVAAYLSTDNLLSNNDVQVGVVTNENTPVGSMMFIQNMTIPGTLAVGNYFLIVKADINNSISESNESNNVSNAVAFSVTTGGGSTSYCNSQGNSPWIDWIGKVELTNLSNPSGKSMYSNFTNLTANVVRGATHPIKLTVAYSWETFNEYWKVWIDYNHNNVFDEPSEIAYSGTQNKPANGTLSALLNVNITIPNSALTGPTRMRVSMKRGSLPTPCEAFPFGEVEDYMVNIQPTIQGLMADLPTPAQADIYPNPANYEAFVNLDDFYELPLTMSLTDLNGRIVWTKSYESVGQREEILPVSELKEGLYLLYLQCPKFRPIVSKLMIIKE